jgi:hypothetical protein
MQEYQAFAVEEMPHYQVLNVASVLLCAVISQNRDVRMKDVFESKENLSRKNVSTHIELKPKLLTSILIEQN